MDIYLRNAIESKMTVRYSRSIPQIFPSFHRINAILGFWFCAQGIDAATGQIGLSLNGVIFKACSQW